MGSLKTSLLGKSSSVTGLFLLEGETPWVLDVNVENLCVTLADPHSSQVVSALLKLTGCNSVNSF